MRRFLADFMFQLDKKEFSELVAICDHLQKLKYRPTLPYVFTEQGVAMLAAVLNSQRAIDVNIQIMRAFIQLRNYALSNVAINGQIAELRQLLTLHIENTDNKFSEHQEAVAQIVRVLNNLMESPKEPKKIGFSSQ